MINQTQTIPCQSDTCTGSVLFDPYQLVAGKKFACPACGAAHGLSQKSEGKVRETMDEFDKMKAGAVRV